MQVKIVLSEEAKNQFAQIIYYLASQGVNKTAATQYIQKLFARVKAVLGIFPESGKRIPSYNQLYQLVIEEYVFIYHYDNSVPRITIVTHYRENQQSALNIDDLK
jgi:plasmid stabilization system protein ParE